MVPFKKMMVSFKKSDMPSLTKNSFW